METFLLGVAYHLRLVQAAATRPARGRCACRRPAAGCWDWPRRRLWKSPIRRLCLFSRTWRSSPIGKDCRRRLIAKLTRFAAWKNLSTACTLQLEPDTVYRALESGETYESIRQTLEQHSSKTLPNAVLDLLRTWSNKRDRITVYPSATLLEFATPEDLQEALARGVPGIRISDRMAVVANEEEMEFRHFRLSGTRDYALPPDRCVTVESDGVTLAVDLARSDLLLETELPRFAELIDRPTTTGRRLYRLTPDSCARVECNSEHWKRGFNSERASRCRPRRGC